MTLRVGEGTVQCPKCGYAPIHDANAMRDEPPPRQRERDLADVRPISRHEPSPRQESLFYSGMLALKRGDRRLARQHFLSALELNQAFTDPWFWLVSTTDDPAEQHKYLEWVLGYEPDHMEAIKAMALLEGRLKQEDLMPKPPEDIHPRAPKGKGTIRRLSPRGPVEAQAAKMTCPQCGGKLTYDVVQRKVICWNCHYQRNIEVRADAHQDMLVEALLKRKYQAQRWEATARALVCGSCGATVTLSARTMTDQCAFCGSPRVLVSDNKDSFEQPDGIIPFMYTADEALEAVRTKMNKGIRALTRFFRDAISRDEAHPMYVPFWAFDAMAQMRWSYPSTIYKGEDAFMMTDVLALASDTLERKRVEQILPFDLHQMRKYDPRYLSDWPAEIYHLDVDEASLHARQEISQRGKRKIQAVKASSKRVRRRGRSEETVKLHISPANISGMTYRLLLAPVWLVLLYEEDGDVRRCLVNGQTGKVAIGGRLGGIF